MMISGYLAGGCSDDIDAPTDAIAGTSPAMTALCDLYKQDVPESAGA